MSRYISLNDILSKDEIKDDSLLCRVVAVYDSVEINHKSIEVCAGIFSAEITKRYKKGNRKDLVAYFMGCEIYKKLKEAKWKPSLYCGGKTIIGKLKIYNRSENPKKGGESKNGKKNLHKI